MGFVSHQLVSYSNYVLVEYLIRLHPTSPQSERRGDSKFLGLKNISYRRQLRDSRRVVYPHPFSVPFETLSKIPSGRTEDGQRKISLELVHRGGRTFLQMTQVLLLSCRTTCGSVRRCNIVSTSDYESQSKTLIQFICFKQQLYV